jgi:hypothetical protein
MLSNQSHCIFLKISKKLVFENRLQQLWPEPPGWAESCQRQLSAERDLAEAGQAIAAE